MESLEAGTVSACALALLILIVFCTYTWIKWRRNLSQCPQAADPENGRIPEEEKRLKSPSFKEGNYNQAVSTKSMHMDNIKSTETSSTKERAHEEKEENQDPDCYPYQGRRRGDSFRDRKTQQETTYL